MWTVLIGWYNLQSAYTSRHELGNVCSLCSLPWESPPGMEVTYSLKMGPGKVVISKSLPLTMLAEEGTEPKHQVKVRLWPDAAWSSRWEAVLTICRCQMGRNSYWTCETPRALLRASCSVWPTTSCPSTPHPRCRLQMCLHPATEHPPQMQHHCYSPRKSYGDGKNTKYIE